MKTISQSAVITPSILILALLAAAVVFIGATGKRVPLLSNIRVDIILLVIIGMTMCTQGRNRTCRRDRSVVASAFDHWVHPRRLDPAHHPGCLRGMETPIYTD